jgi:hypothetical protein
VPIELAGTLPLSAVNVGLAASVGGVSAEVSKLQADITDLTPAVAASVEVASHFPPNPTSFAAVIAADLSLAEIASRLNPANFATIGAELSASGAARLGLIEGEIAVVESIRGQLAGGLTAGDISGWSFSGRCDGFGPLLERETRSGFGKLGPAEQVTGVIIVTQSLSGWGQLAKSVSADPAPAGDSRLISHGTRSAAQWNTGVAKVAVELDAFLDELRGMKASLEANARVEIGLDLPDPSVLLDAGVQIFDTIGIDGLLDNLVNVRTDVGASIGAIRADVDAAVSLSGEISGQLSAGGFSVWIYSGRADGFGAAVTGALAAGLPGGSGPGALVYGLALAGTGPSMSTFGSIFKTAA